MAISEEGYRKMIYFHLPGLFEFYDFYSVFLPLFREIENIFMIGVKLVRYTVPRQTVFGAVVVQVLESAMLKLY